MHPKDYIAEVQSADSQNGEQDQLSRTEIAQEYVLMGLRCTDGISLRHLAQICDNQINPDVLAAHVRDGYLARNGDRITPTSKGFALLDTLTLSLLS